MNKRPAPKHDKHDPDPPIKRSDWPFLTFFVIVGGSYILMIVAMLVAESTYTTPDHLWNSLQSPEIRAAIKLSFFSCTISALLSLWVAVPIGYIMSRYRFRGKAVIDSILDIPIVLPPLVIGLCLLILFQTPLGNTIDNWCEQATGSLVTWISATLSWWMGRPILMGRPVSITYDIPAVILAQFMVACAFAVRTMRVTFDQIDPRYEQVALTLGCSQSQAFWRVVFPQARQGLLAAGTLAWARSLGEFGPILVFAGATRSKTEVLSTTVFLELSVGDLEAAVAVSLLMVLAAMLVLIIARSFGLKNVSI